MFVKNVCVSENPVSVTEPINNVKRIARINGERLFAVRTKSVKL